MAADGPHASSAGLAKHPTESHWHSEAGWVPDPQPVPAVAPFVVIGGGLCGVGTAYWLNQRGHDCVLIEGRTLAGGASGRNGGVISPTHATPQSRAFHEENIAHLAGVLEEQGIDCEYRVGGYLSLAYEDTVEAGRVGKQAEDDTTEYWDAEKVQSELGGAETFVVDGAPRKIAGGMFKRDSGHVWPAKLVQTLAKSCTRTIFCTHTVALSLAAAGPDSSRVVVQTDKGTVITERVCVCTNGWAPRLLPQLGRTGALHPVRNNVVMTAPYKKTWAWPGSVSSMYGSEYMYCMRRPDGRLVIGGARNHDPASAGSRGGAVAAGFTGDDDSVGSKEAAARLKEFLSELLRNFGEELVVEKEWSGVMGWTQDGKPLVGELPPALLQNELKKAAGSVFVGAGFNGHGMPVRSTVRLSACVLQATALLLN